MSEQRPSGSSHKRELSDPSGHSEQQRRLQAQPSQEHSRPSSSRHSSSRHDDVRVKRSPPGTTSPGSSYGEGSSRGPTWKTESLDRGHNSTPPQHSGDDDGQSPRPVTPGANIAVNRNQPAFISKLYAMLQDPKYTEANLIYWAPDGRSFICPNPIEFARDVLPNFYKTNNFQSFVRQLNMYSFNKVSDLCSATQSDPSAWEFRHPLFCRDEPEKIHLIQRKAGGRAAADRRPAHASPGDEHASRPSTTGHLFNSPQRPHTVRHNSAPRISDGTVYHPASHPPARYDERAAPPSFRYEREPQTTFWNHTPAAAAPQAGPPEGEVVALERELQFLWGKMQAERHEAARQSLDLHGHLLRMADMVADLSPSVGEEMYAFRSDVVERYKQLQRQVADGQRYFEASSQAQQHPPSSSHSSSSHHLDRYHPYRRASPEERSRPSSSRYGAVPRAYPLPYERYERYERDEDRYYRHGSEPRHRRFEDRPPLPPADAPQPASLRNILH